ncbi:MULTISPECIES: MFS transporter [unclassified Pseudomonas]|uniref:MFS transporter n=1 Tax=unclassified Pseudomonas TaxID=196821 RepID=UPI000BD679D2|nr:MULTISPECIES: MFS transporter [unclassified Pseudomonas]PVZ16467.1 ACS family D-galactonate transporter-like MFS transporter [Pseudomonas sp. URIL14HWK12:I12]PVZ25677.1 ACS family D-galactonate transporter-like MFS transporter [Pseudomonas sp. URIL14HWK12:I10]PVZ36799.1 ACS family D-galactonate transporter-like MFS transporter [Pseudomonas sp. URIL14HWK12:I11]SNZ12590.1 MFS transporter, ACS family, D-galactonate transporter [Pseudomonas sp. URIL14HWK12:I9]
MSTEPSLLATPAEQAQRSRTRFMILALVSGGTLINYLDRSVMGIAAPAISSDLALNAAMMGIIFSAFSWTYAASQIPGGILIDRLGTKLTYWLALTLWSLFTGLQGLAQGFASLLGMRLAVGAAEAPCFPTNSRVVATWFPQSERARATGIYTFAEYVGLAFLSPLLFWVLHAYGWRVLLMGVGAVGILYGLLWWAKYHEPHQSRSANQAELDYIREGGGVVDGGQQATRFAWSQIPALLKHRNMLGICLGQFACNSTNVFFLTWFPTYLVTERHMPWLKVGWVAVLPFIAASVGTLFGGWLSDALLRRGYSLNVARKLPVITGLLTASVIVLANYVQSDALVIAILCVAYFAQGMSALAWMIVSDIAPKGMLGLSGGVFNLFANAAGIVTPLTIGLIVSATGSFVWALAFVAAITVLGALCYLFMVRDLARLPAIDNA